MGYPFVLYDNVFGDYDGTLSGTAMASGFERANAGDWKAYTFWKTADASTANQTLQVDLGASITRGADTVVLYSHNANHGDVPNVVVEWSTNGSAWTGVALSPTDSVDSTRIFVATFTNPTAKRYWRVTISAGTTRTVAPFAGIICLGLRLDFTEGFPGDPFAQAPEGDSPISYGGYFLGADVRLVGKPIDLDFSRSPAGVASTFWTTAASGKQDVTGDDWIQTHLRSAKPFFIGWNNLGSELDSEGVWLTRVRPGSSIGQGFIGTTLRRNFTLSLEAIQET